MGGTAVGMHTVEDTDGRKEAVGCLSVACREEDNVAVGQPGGVIVVVLTGGQLGQSGPIQPDPVDLIKLALAPTEKRLLTVVGEIATADLPGL